MIPQRFATEYPERCGQLLDMLEPQAREAKLVGSLSLLIASAAFTIPFGRIVEIHHPLGRQEPDLAHAIKGLRKTSFLEAPFWEGNTPEFIRYARITNNPEQAWDWQDDAGNHPIVSADMKDGHTILRTIRNALAHGNVVYLDENGHESPGEELRYLAFLSKHDDEKSHRIVIFGEEDFLTFLKAWIVWIQAFPRERHLDFSDVA